MEQITIRIKDRKKEEVLKNFLRALDFIEIVGEPQVNPSPKRRRVKPPDFFSLAGIWAGREISLEIIRKRAWPGRE